MNITELLEKHRSNPKIAIKYGNKSITYSDWYAEAKRVSELLDIIIQKSCKTVALFLPNSINYAIAYFGVLFAGRTVVPIDVKSTSSEICSMLEYCETDIVLTDSEYADKLISGLSVYRKKINIVDIEKKTTIVLNNTGDYVDKTVNKELNDVAVLLHTSGTTDNPKRVMLTHENLYVNVISNIKSLMLSENEIFLISLPMQFGYCNTAQFLTSVYLGSTIIILNSLFTAKKFFELVEKEKITIYTAVPTILMFILKYKYTYKYNVETLRYLCFGGGFISKEIIWDLHKKFPSIGFVQTYGMTECSPRVTLLLPKYINIKNGSVGLPIPGVEIKVIDEYGEEVVQKIGEINVRGRNVMKGYYKDPDETNKKIVNGWLKSGDIGYLDEDGFLYITGRIKNIIISGGLNIYPEEIEQVMLSYPGISDVFVFGKDDEFMGEIPCAKIVVSDRTITKEEIIKHCLSNLSSYKVPQNIEFVDNIPKTYNGKTKREM